MVDKTKTTMDQSLKGRWISVSWHRKSDSFDFFAYNVGVVLEVKNGVCTIDYKDDGIHFIPLKQADGIFPQEKYQNAIMIGVCF